jgi:hypothetical protein
MSATLPGTLPMTTQNIADLAWAGRHDAAVAACGAALQQPALPAGDRMALLELRAESLIAQGRLADAAADTAAMLALAARHQR